MPKIETQLKKKDDVEEVEVSNEETVVEEVIEEVAVDPSELRAKEKGWVPKEEFDGDPDEWVTAKEFLARGPLMETIHKLNRKIKKMEESLGSAEEHFTKVAFKQKEREVEDLKLQLKQASENRDINSALEIKDKINELEQESTKRQSKSNADFDEWVKDNSWYNDDSELKEEATAIGYGLQTTHPDWAVSKILEETTKKIKRYFPEKFKTKEQLNEGKPKVTNVSTSSKTVSTQTRQSVKDKLPSYRDLPDEAKLNYRRLVKSDKNPHGILTPEKFMQQYVASGGPINQSE